MVRLAVITVAAALGGSAVQAEEPSMLDAMGVTSVSIGFVHAPEISESAGTTVVRTRRCVLSRAEGEAAMRAVTSGETVEPDYSPGPYPGKGDHIQGSELTVAYVLRFERRTGLAILVGIPRVDQPATGTRLILFNSNFRKADAARLAEVERLIQRPDCGVQVDRAAQR
jgi:hypothetical protein